MGTLLQYDRPMIVAKRRAAHNYGHFLLEMLPMAHVGAAVTDDKALRFLVHRVPPSMQDVVFRAFRLLGIQLDRLLVLGEREPMFFHDLVVVRGLTHHGTYMSALSLQLLEHMADRCDLLLPLSVPVRGHDRIFVRRVPGWRRGRDLLNEEEVSQRLSHKGFPSIEPGSRSFKQQIRIFRNARQVVGTIGAAMTNIAFCRPGTDITLLCPATFPDTFFWFIATHKRLGHREIRGDQVTYEPPDSWTSGFTLREKDIAFWENLHVPVAYESRVRLPAM